MVRCHHPWSHSGSPAPCPLSQGAHLPSEAAVSSEFSLPWSAWLATTLPLFVLRRTLKARFIFLKDLLLIVDRSKGRAEDKWEGRNSSYSLTEILFYVRVWSDIHNNMKRLLLGGRKMGFASLCCLFSTMTHVWLVEKSAFLSRWAELNVEALFLGSMDRRMGRGGESSGLTSPLPPSPITHF